MDYICIITDISNESLYPLTRNVPKHLIEINGNTILYNIISYWKNICPNFLIFVKPEHYNLTNVFIKRYINSYKIIEYNTHYNNDISNILNDSFLYIKSKNILITSCDIYPISPIIIPNKNTLFMNNCNKIDIYYFMNYDSFNLDNINTYEIEKIINISNINYLLNEKNKHITCRSFNNITINGNILIKTGINSYGEDLIKKEINFYNRVKDFNITPKILDYSTNSITMEYLDDYKHPTHIEQIIKIFSKLHLNDITQVSKNIFLSEILEETIIKIKKRYEKIKDIIEILPSVKYFNDIKLISFNESLSKLETKIINYVNNLKIFEFCLIHGDPNFGNILIKNEDIKLIDSRGFFGKQILIGPKEYDIGKLYFSMSGYDIFRNNNEFTFEIKEKTVYNDIFQKYEIFGDNIYTYIMISLWLGLPEYLINEPIKLIFSYYYGLYLATIYLID